MPRTYSRNRLFWHDLTGFTALCEPKATLLKPTEILALAPQMIQYFGEKREWLEEFVHRAVLEACLGVIDENGIAAACLTADRTCPCISTIFVRVDLRRQGWAKRLLRDVLSRLKQQQAPCVIAHVKESNLNSGKLFRAAGFQRIDHSTDLLALGRCAGYLNRRELMLLDENYDDIAQACREAGILLR